MRRDSAHRKRADRFAFGGQLQAAGTQLVTSLAWTNSRFQLCKQSNSSLHRIGLRAYHALLVHWWFRWRGVHPGHPSLRAADHPPVARILGAMAVLTNDEQLVQCCYLREQVEASQVAG